VFCRNLLIYFDQPTQKQVFDVLKNLTHVDGVLFIGPAEGSLLGRHGMRSIGVPQSFAFSRHTEPVKPEPVFVPMPVPPPRHSVAPIPPKPRPFSTFSAQVVPISAPPSDDGDLLNQIAILANEGKSAEARAACERYLSQHPPAAQVFYWLGLLSDVAGSALEAQGFYRKALYLEPQHPQALMQLAGLLEAQGDTAGARRLQARAARSELTASKKP
jgi:chemotaxis protein methyltransferase WspC